MKLIKYLHVICNLKTVIYITVLSQLLSFYIKQYSLLAPRKKNLHADEGPTKKWFTDNNNINEINCT